MSDKILSLRPPLTHIDFYALFKSEELAQKEGERILQAIAFIAQPTLSYLDLGGNHELWEDDSRFDLLLDVTQQQHNLDHLHLNYSFFSPVQTE